MTNYRSSCQMRVGWRAMLSKSFQCMTHLRKALPVAACSDAAAALETHPLVSEAAVTTLHSRVLAFVTLESPHPPAAEQEARAAALQVVRLFLCQALTAHIALSGELVRHHVNNGV